MRHLFAVRAAVVLAATLAAECLPSALPSDRLRDLDPR